MFVVLAEAMERHIGAQAAGFVNQIFSLHETTEIQQLLSEAGFRDIVVQANNKVLNAPPPKEFLWQFVSSTPLAGMVAEVADEFDTLADRWDESDTWSFQRYVNPLRGPSPTHPLLD